MIRSSVRGAIVAVSLLFVSGTSAIAADRDALRVNPLPRSQSHDLSAKSIDPALPPDVSSLGSTLRSHLLQRAIDRHAEDDSRLKVAARSRGGRLPMIGESYREGSGAPVHLRIETALPDSIALLSIGPSLQRDESIARRFLEDRKGTLRIDHPKAELHLESWDRDAIGRSLLRFSQSWRGVPLWPSDLNVHIDDLGAVDLVDGHYRPVPRRLVTIPTILPGEAAERARETMNPAGTAVTETPELLIYTPAGRLPRLAWRVDTYTSLIQRQYVLVDALNGEILDTISRVHGEKATGSGIDLLGMTRTLQLWRQGGTYYMLNAAKSMFDPASQPPYPATTRGAIFILDARNNPPASDPNGNVELYFITSANPNSWPIRESVSAAHWLSATYDFYLDVHGRNSIDGQGGNLNGIVRFGTGVSNAFWVDATSQIVFGDADRFAASLDIIGHEVSHGVTSNSANLIYRDQPGALNEAMSDIFGEMVEFRVNGSNDWIIGSQLTSSLRSMSSPGQFGDPSKMSQFVQTKQDHGGIHTNSGIINHAFYQLAQGMNGAIGRDAAQRIFYRALTRHLTKNSQFLDARLAAIASAEELYGKGSTQAAMTAKAFDAVEIFGASPSPPSSPTPPVNNSDSTLFLFFDPDSGANFLGRKETADDGDLGTFLSFFSVGSSRPSVTGDGSLAVFVDSLDDVCLTLTDGSIIEECLDLPTSGIRVSSVGMSPDGTRFGFILLGQDDLPEPEITLVDLATDTSSTVVLEAPVFDGGTISSILFADAMDFTSDGRYLIFDAFNVMRLVDGTNVGAWSIYALEIDSELFFDVVPPIAGLDIGFPQLGNTRDDLLTFEVLDSETAESIIVAANLDTGDLSVLGFVTGVNAAPAFNGNDRAIVFSFPTSTPTGTGLGIQQLASDHLTAVGNPSVWISDAALPVIYRRGTWNGPTTKPGAIGFDSPSYHATPGARAIISVGRRDGNKGAVSIQYATSNGTGQSGRDFTSVSGTLSWSDGEMGSKSFQVPILSGATGGATVTLRLTSPSGGVSTDRVQSTLSIQSTTAPPSPGRRRATSRPD